VICFTPPRKDLPLRLDRRLGGLQKLRGRCEEEKRFLSQTGIESLDLRFSKIDWWCSKYFYKRNINYVRFEIFTAVTMKDAVFWDVAPCRSSVN
jgi:hypothetical protein